MRFKGIWTFIAAMAVALTVVFGPTIEAHAKHKLTAKDRELLRNAYQNHLNAAEEWNRYNRKLGRAQDDVRRVRNGAITGAIRGGPAGAAWGAARGAAEGIGLRIMNRQR